MGRADCVLRLFYAQYGIQDPKDNWQKYEDDPEVFNDPSGDMPSIFRHLSSRVKGIVFKSLALRC